MKIEQGDITTCRVDAIVNAANAALSGGGGVDGAIHRVAGPELQAACRKLGRCEPGNAVITPGLDLPARFVIHAVGPVWRGGGAGEAILLARSYRRSLELAVEQGLKRIVFPAISCGAYKYPLDQAAEVAVSSISAVEQTLQSAMMISVICFDSKTHAAFENAWRVHRVDE